MKNLYLTVLTGILLAGCATTQKVGQRKMLDVSTSKPDWIHQKEDTWDKKEDIFFRVNVMQQYDLNMGLEAAKAIAVKEVSEEIYMKVSSELGLAMMGNSSRQGNAGKYLKSAVAAEADQVELSGLISQESYWERYEELTYNGVTYNYDVYRKFKISKSDFEMAKERILNKALFLAQNANDKKAEVELEKLFDKNSATVEVKKASN